MASVNWRELVQSKNYEGLLDDVREMVDDAAAATSAALALALEEWATEHPNAVMSPVFRELANSTWAALGRAEVV